MRPRVLRAENSWVPGNLPSNPSDFGGFPDRVQASSPSQTEGVTLAGTFGVLPPPPGPNHPPPAPPAHAGSLELISTARSPKKSGAMAPSTKHGLWVVATVVLICFTIFGVFFFRQVASLAVIDDLEVGECVEDHFEPLSDTAEGDFFEILFVTRVDCAQAHAYEVYAATALWETGAVFPGVDSAFSRGEGYCQEQYAQFLGENYLNLPYEFFTFVPTVDLWNEGHRDVQCLVGHTDGQTLVTGSLRAAGSFVTS